MAHRASSPAAKIGAAIVAFRSEAVIAQCLDSLLASGDTVPRVVVVDNASPDASCDVIRRWAARHAGRVSFAEAEVGAIAPESTAG